MPFSLFSTFAFLCQKLKKHAEADSVAARAAFLRTLHHTRPAVPDGDPAKIEGPRVWQKFEDGEWKDYPVPAPAPAEELPPAPAPELHPAPAPAPADELLGELLAATTT